MESGRIAYHADALLAATLHVNRLNSLVVYKYSRGLQVLLDYFPFPAPLLKELKIVFSRVPGSDAAIPGENFPEDLTVAQVEPVRCRHAPTLEESIESHGVRALSPPDATGFSFYSTAARLFRERTSPQKNRTLPFNPQSRRRSSQPSGVPAQLGEAHHQRPSGTFHLLRSSLYPHRRIPGLAL